MADEQTGRDFLDSIDALLESACFDPATRGEVLADFATQGVDGSGYGVPVGVPQLVVLKDGETVAASGAQSNATSGGNRGGTGPFSSSGGQGWESGSADGGGNHRRPSIAKGQSPDGDEALGEFGGAGNGSGDSYGGGTGFRRGGGSSSFMDLVE